MLKNRIDRLREQIPSWLDRRLLLLILTLIVFSMAMAWGEPIPQAAAMQANNVEKSEMHPVQQETHVEAELLTVSPEILGNREQTNGIIMGSVVLILVIIGASAGAVYQKAHE